MWRKFWRSGLIRAPLNGQVILAICSKYGPLCVWNKSKSRTNFFMWEKGVGLYFHKSHSINAFSIIIKHWLHKFGWLISSLCWGYTTPCYRDWGLTISGHAQRHALLEAAELAPVPVHSVHHAVLLPGTLVICHTRLRPPEETLEIIECGIWFWQHSLFCLPCIPHTWWLRSGLRWTCRRTPCRGWSQFVLQKERVIVMIIMILEDIILCHLSFCPSYEHHCPEHYCCISKISY